MFHLLKIFTKYGFCGLMIYINLNSESCYDYYLYITAINIFSRGFFDL